MCAPICCTGHTHTHSIWCGHLLVGRVGWILLASCKQCWICATGNTLHTAAWRCLCTLHFPLYIPYTPTVWNVEMCNYCNASRTRQTARMQEKGVGEWKREHKKKFRFPDTANAIEHGCVSYCYGAWKRHKRAHTCIHATMPEQLNIPGTESNNEHIYRNFSRCTYFDSQYRIFGCLFSAPNIAAGTKNMYIARFDNILFLFPLFSWI